MGAYMQDQTVATIESAFLCRALFEIYMDGAPVSTNIYSSLQQGFARHVPN
jgi:hypothetical protein